MKIPSPAQLKTTLPAENEKAVSDFENKVQGTNEFNFPHYKRVSDYLLGTCIGEGSFAKVRVGFHCPTKEKVAVKIINKAKARKDSYVYKNLHREGRLLQMLRHPNIIQVFDVLETGNNYYLVTELCDGGELIDIVTEEGSLPEEKVCKYIHQLVNSVEYMHRRKIVHRDLKVENLLLDSEGNLKIIDFGLSNILADGSGDQSSSLTTQCGSPAYAAPELLAKKSYGPKVDVWSIGVITYALLVGKLPFTVDPFSIPKLCKKMMRGEMNSIPSRMSTQCRAFIKKLLTPDQEQRPSIREVSGMKWLSLSLSGSRLSLLDDSISSLHIENLENDGNIRRRHNHLTPLIHPPINSSIVRDMNSEFGFVTSSVIQCVQKNRPGPALATYHLLNKKKRKSRMQKQVSSLQSEESKKVLQENKLDNTNEVIGSFNGESSVTSSDGAEEVTAPPVKSPEHESKYKENDTMVAENSITKPSSENSESSAMEKAKETMPILKPVTFASSATDDAAPPALSRIDRRSIDNEVALDLQKILAPNKKTNLTQCKSKFSNPAPTPTYSVMNTKSEATNVSEILAKMRKDRQLLTRKQQMHQQQEHHNLTGLEKKITRFSLPDTCPKSDIGSEPQTQNVTKLPGRKSFPLPHKAVHQLPLDKRSSSQQDSRHKIGTHLELRAPSYKRPASQNAVPEKAQLIMEQTRQIYAPTLPRRNRKMSSLDHSETVKSDLNQLPSPDYKHPSQFTLPHLVTKTVSKAEKPPALRQQNSYPSRITRRSVPASYNYHRTSNLTQKISPDSQIEAIRYYDRNSLDSKQSVMSRWHKQYGNDINRNFKPHYDRFENNETVKQATRQRPKKVISEPIAAAISYLTATKHKTFRKDKPTSITTG